MKTRVKLLLNFVLALSMLLALVPFGAGAAPAELESPPPALDRQGNATSRLGELEKATEISTELAWSKIDPLLLDAAQAGGKELVDLYVSVQAGTNLSKYFVQSYTRPVIFGGTQNIYGKTEASNLIKIAQETHVVALVATGAELRDKPYDPESEDAPQNLVNLEDRLAALRENEVSYAEALADDVGAAGWFDVLDGHKSSDAWDKGFTGNGVIVGVLDDGIDFGHPDLHGTYAVVTDPSSPYYGWPMAFSQVSMVYFMQDIVFDVAGIAEGWGGSRWTDAQTTAEARLF